MYEISKEGSHLTFFFAHRLLVKLTQNFLNIFVMDSTYKINRYKMSLLDIMKISSFNTFFIQVLFFFKREREEDYIWVLKMFSKILDEKQPCVVIN
jgi:MULE transposase domain